MIILQLTGCLFLRDGSVLHNLYGAKTVAMHTFTHSLSLIDSFIQSKIYIYINAKNRTWICGQF